MTKLDTEIRYGTVGGCSSDDDRRIIVDREIRYRMVDCSRCIIVEVIARRPNLLRIDTLEMCWAFPTHASTGLRLPRHVIRNS